VSAAPPPLPDEPARRRIREELDATLIVEAAAGTGKTTALVSRIVKVLSAGVTQLDRIIAVTFTEKAAGEMKLRLRAGLERARISPTITAEERARLDAALAHLEVARIGTIHSLCADLLRERPVEARVDPLFEIITEDEAERIFSHTFDAWFHQALKHPPEGVRRALRRGGGRDRKGPREALRRAAWGLIDHRDFTASWRRDPLEREEEIDRIITLLRAISELGERAARPTDYLALNFKKIEHFIAEIDRREQVRGRDYDALEGELALALRWKEWKRGGGSSSSYGPGLLRADVIAERNAALAELEGLVEQLNADLAACLRDELRPLIARYDDQKARAGKLDFLDLLLKTRDLVREQRSVREELQQRFDRIFVDEFQDTDPLQAEILLLLAADDPSEDDFRAVRPVPGKLFLVGDPKQSIYRFRRADVQLYESIKEQLREQGAALLYLTTSFRSSPAIQDLVNAAFAPVMQRKKSPRPFSSSSQAEYVALEKHRAALSDQPTIVALPVPRPYDEWGKIKSRSIDASLPDGVGAFVDWLIHESGWKVTGRSHGDSNQPIPLEARHICLLFKRFQSSGEDLTRAYVRALEARRIPHVLVGGRGFHDREEVQAVRNALAAIEWPDDELAVYATLRGPLFALSDDALLAYRQALGDGRSLGPLSPLRNTSPVYLEWENTREVSAALAILRKLHLARNHRPIADTIARLLDATRAHAGIAIWPTGEQALANVLRVMDRARRFEAAGTTSFRAFVERLEAEAEAGQASEAPVVEEGTEGVRIMTVHRAKGLEFPVVVLADPSAPTTYTQPSRYVDHERRLWAETLASCMPIELVERRDEELERDREETIRLAYVAATRARDLLVVPVVGDEELRGWLDALNPTLYPRPSERRRARPAPGCPPFGDDSVLARPLRAERSADDSVAPGLHCPRAGEHEVLWWDPRVLDLDKQPEGGLRQQRILAADDHGVVSEEGVLAHEAWSERRSELLERGATPSLPIVTATEIAEEGAPPTLALSGNIEHEHTKAERHNRPRGKRFGTLVHAVLAEVDLDEDGAGIETIAATQGRLVGATPAEVAASVSAVKAALTHPLLVRAAASARRGECRREAPVLLPLPDGTVLEGVVDLAFREQSAQGPVWTVVDFKTDAEIEGRQESYEAQVRLYVKAIHEATGEASVGVLLSV